MKYKFECGGRHKYFNCVCQLKKYGADDCTMRSIVIATGLDYKFVWDSLADLSKETGYLPNSREICEMFLNKFGWERHSPFKKGNTNKKYKLRNVPIEKDKNYIFQTSGHWTAVVDGVVLDTWDCREWCANSYWMKKATE